MKKVLKAIGGLIGAVMLLGILFAPGTPGIEASKAEASVVIQQQIYGPGHWAWQGTTNGKNVPILKKLVDDGLIQANGYYIPPSVNQPVTRALGALDKWHFLGRPAKPKGFETTFTDIGNLPKEQRDAIEALQGHNLVVGYGSGKFGPNDTMTREQAAAIISRAMEGANLKDLPTPSIYTLPFLDVTPDRWSANAIALLVADDDIAGYPDNTFKPEKPITRAEFDKIVAFVAAKHDLVGNYEHKTPEEGAKVTDYDFDDIQIEAKYLGDNKFKLTVTYEDGDDDDLKDDLKDEDYEIEYRCDGKKIKTTRNTEITHEVDEDDYDEGDELEFTAQVVDEDGDYKSEKASDEVEIDEDDVEIELELECEYEGDGEIIAEVDVVEGELPDDAEFEYSVDGDEYRTTDDDEITIRVRKDGTYRISVRAVDEDGDYIGKKSNVEKVVVDDLDDDDDDLYEDPPTDNDDDLYEDITPGEGADYENGVTSGGNNNDDNLYEPIPNSSNLYEPAPVQQ